MTGNDMNYVSEEIQDLAERGWAVSVEEYKELRMNSYERRFLLPYVSDETLCTIVVLCLNNCERHSLVTYDGNLQEVLVPELVNRLIEG